MRIVGKRVQRLARYMPTFAPGSDVVPALVEIHRYDDRIGAMGFSVPPLVGDTLLPPVVGRRTRENANGHEVIHRDQPMEQAWVDGLYRWLEWHGKESVEQWGVRSRPYWRYPRTPVPPQDVQLTVLEQASGATAIATERFVYGRGDQSRLLHAVNVMLELFGECEILTGNLEPIFGVPTRTLNWRMLPAGVRSTQQVRDEVDEVTRDWTDAERHVAEHRWRMVEQHGPDQIGVGQAGFRGYLAFEFRDASIWVLESLQQGNATYLFGEDWETLSRLTKTQILADNLAVDRIVHARGWEGELAVAIESRRSG